MKRILTILLLLTLILSMAGCLTVVPQTPASPATTETPASYTTPTPIDPTWSPPPVESSTPPLPSIADVVGEVYPSVVTISTEVVTLDFFLRPQTQTGAGSGWILDKNGIIATNNHVVEGAKKVTVQLADGRTFQADPDNVYRAPWTDLAVI